jgi:hypothetical protein
MRAVIEKAISQLAELSAELAEKLAEFDAERASQYEQTRALHEDVKNV